MNNDIELIIAEEEENTKINAPIFRFKFTEEFMEELYKFAKIHQYDHRKDFKEAWQIWLEENEDIVQEEEARLHYLRYEGDIQDKMFKSARYYFRKKSTVKVEPKKRRQYIGVSHELLEAMDMHIRSNIGLTDYQPKTGFADFYEENKDIITRTFQSLNDQNINDRDFIQAKLKKTYKNRYFMLVSK